MRVNRKNKVVTMAALIVAVLALGVGFAAFSTQLTIGTSAKVTPSSTDFAVNFSSNGTTAATTATTITPTVQVE